MISLISMIALGYDVCRKCMRCFSGGGYEIWRYRYRRACLWTKVLICLEYHANFLSPTPAGVSGSDSSNNGPMEWLASDCGRRNANESVPLASAPALGLRPVQVMGDW